MPGYTTGLLAFAAFLINIGQSQAQANDEHECGVIEISAAKHTSNSSNKSSPCFNPQTVMNSELEIWMKVHVHLFFKDDCSGDFLEWNGLSGAIAENDIYDKVDDMFTQANGIMENLEIAWSDQSVFGISQASELAYSPVRFLVEDVSIHCNTADQFKGTQLGYLQNAYSQPDVLNLFIAENSFGNGIAYVGGTSMSVENLAPSLFLHEAFHLLNLQHAFEPQEAIADTPMKSFDTDWNWDGDFTDFFSDMSCDAAGRESQRTCYAKQAPNESIDYDGDCADDYTLGSINYNCTSWSWQSNNIMDYGAYKINVPALTEGQISKSLAHIETGKCDEIAGIADICKPANSVVEAYPDRSDYCGISVSTVSSLHNDRYRLSVYNQSGGLVATTNYRYSVVPARITLRNDYDKFGNVIPGDPFNDGEVYTAVLETDGSCGDSDVAQTQVIATITNCDLTTEPDEPLELKQQSTTSNHTTYIVTGAPNTGYEAIVTDDASGKIIDSKANKFSSEGKSTLELTIEDVRKNSPYTVSALSSYGEKATHRSIKTQ